jgi:hypothetical protein
MLAAIQKFRKDALDTCKKYAIKLSKVPFAVLIMGGKGDHESDDLPRLR